jgi:hypothetical protein
MKKIYLKSISERLNEKELENVLGGTDYYYYGGCLPEVEITVIVKPCAFKQQYDDCTYNGKSGICRYASFAGLVCYVGPWFCG